MMGRRPFYFFVFPLGVLVGGSLFWGNTGCDPTEFDDLAKKAPVQFKGTPEGLDHFGRGLVSLGGTGAEYHPHVVAVGGTGPQSISTVRLTKSGGTALKSGGETYEGNDEVTSLALVEGDGEFPYLIAGVPKDGVVYLAGFENNYVPDSQGIRLVGNDLGLLGTMNFGGAVTAAKMGPVLGADPTSTFWVVSSSHYLYIFTDPRNDPDTHVYCHADSECFGAGEECESYRAQDRGLMAGRLFSAPGESDGRLTVAAGIPKKGATGTVKLIYYFGDGTSTLSECVEQAGFATVVLEAPGGADEPRFGASVLTVDLDDDGWDELLVGAPSSNKVYLYSVAEASRDASPVGDGIGGGWVGLAPTATLEPAHSEGVVAFGSSLVAVDLDGDGEDEIAVGDPLARVGGENNAGRVHLFSVSMSAGPSASVDPLGVLEDAEPQKSSRLGKALAPIRAGAPAGSQDDGPEELAVLADNGLYLFLKTNTSSAD